MGVKIAPDARRQFVNASGVPYSGAKLFYYGAGSTTKQTTYTTSTGSTPNTNPIILDSAGRTPYGVWFTEGLTYKEVLAPSTDTDPPSSPIFTEDNLSGVNDTSVTVSQWAASSLTPTYLSTTSFSVAGDQTTDLHVGRRLQFAVTAGTVYGRISASVYGAVTTVTVAMDSGQALDSGLSSFNWSLLSATNHSIPKLTTAQLTDLGIANTTSYALLAGPTFTGTTTVSTLTVSSNASVGATFTPSQTLGILGTTTNNDANAGRFGEYISSTVAVGSAVSLVTAAAKNVTTISLTAGDWDIYGQVQFRGTSTTVIDSLFGSSSQSTNTFDQARGFMWLSASFAPGATFDTAYSIPTTRLSLGSSATVYLVARATFGTSTLSAYGFISARRAR